MNKLLFPIVIAALFLGGSCTKTSSATNNGDLLATYSSMDTIFGFLSAPAKYVTMNADTGGTFFGASGTRYIFPPSAFIDGSANNVSGNIQLVVTEFLQKGDMIFSGVLPVSNGSALFSAGEIYEYASQNGQQIFLKPGYTFQANVPQGGTPQSGMVFFQGYAGTNITNKVNWQLSDSLTYGSIIYDGDTISIISDSLHYCNADQFMDSPKYQSFTVTVGVTGASLSSSSTVYGYALYDNYKGVWPMTNFSGNVFTEGHVPNIPVHFAVFALINNRFYAGVIAAIPAKGSNYLINLTEVDPASFKSQLNLLVK